MQRWEYRSLVVEEHELTSGAVDARLDALGAEGWELVTGVARDRHGYSHETIFVFKREAGGGAALGR